MKTCTKCKQELPFMLFYKQSARCDGYATACKQCTRMGPKKQHPISRSQRREEYSKGVRTCSKCFALKLLTDFPTGKGWVTSVDPRGYSTQCKLCSQDYKAGVENVYTYVIQNAYTGDIEIGHSRNPNKRLNLLKKANARSLIMLFDRLDASYRGRLYEACNEYRLYGRWFSWSAMPIVLESTKELT